MFKSAINLFISFVLMIAFSCLILLITSITLFSNDCFYLSNINDNYYSFIVQKINDGFQSVELSSGIDSTALNNTVTTADVKNALKVKTYNYIHNLNNGNKPLIKNDNIDKKIRITLNSYAQGNGFVLDSKTKNNIETVVAECDSVFQNNLIQIPYFDNVISNIKAFQTLINTGFVVLIAIIIFLIFALIFLNLKSRNNIIRYIFYGITTCGIFTGLCALLLKSTRYAYKFKFDDVIVRDTVGDIITAYFNTLIIVAFSVSIITIVLFALKSFVKEKS